jgi:hypothetical protein
VMAAVPYITSGSGLKFTQFQAIWYLLDWVYMGSTSQLMLYQETISGDCNICAKYINTICGKSMRFLMLSNDCTNSYQWALKR